MPVIGETTGLEASWSHMIAKATTESASLSTDLNAYLQNLNILQNAASIIRVFSECSESTGSYVQLRPEFEFFPVLPGSNGQVIPLYHFVEVLDELLDYDLVVQELPNLSYSQVGGAISFLRKLSQTNPQNIDLDRIEDEELSSPTAVAELRSALADKETSRVLNRD